MGEFGIVTVATDGSSRGNPGASGWAWVVDGRKWQAGGIPFATNNIAELTAIHRALIAIPANVPLRILTDSEYCVNALTKWRKGWKKNDWQTKDGKQVKNLGLIRAIDHVLQNRTDDWTMEWVRAHTGRQDVESQLNDAADRMATQLSAATEAEGRNAEHLLAGPGWPEPKGLILTPKSASPTAPVWDICPSCTEGINPLTFVCGCGSM